MEALTQDANSFSKEQPLILDQQLQAFFEADLQTFLNHVYLNSEVDSAAAAVALLRVADLFDASKLMAKADAYLEQQSGESMFASPDDILRWLLLAEQFRLPCLMKKCANHAAIRYKDVCIHPSFDQLEGSALKAILKGVHLLTELHPELTEPRAGDLSPRSFKALFGHKSDVTGSATKVRQVYHCKPGRPVQHDGRTCSAQCYGHKGCWSWNSQRQVWQLDSKPAVITKVLPENVLEVADLIGSPKPCTVEQSVCDIKGWW